jgi:hypothetical protein
MIKDVELIASPIVITVQPTGLLLIDLNRLEICFFQQQFIDFMITKVKNSSKGVRHLVGRPFGGDRPTTDGSPGQAPVSAERQTADQDPNAVWRSDLSMERLL